MFFNSIESEGSVMNQTETERHGVLIKVCFACYLVALVYFLLFAERGYSISGYNVTPFAEIKRYIRYHDTLGFKLVILNLGGNILGFLPFGYLLPGMQRCFRNFLLTVFCCFLFSFLIEGIQMIAQVGCFDVDDMILNTFGGALGYLVHLIIESVRRN